VNEMPCETRDWPRPEAAPVTMTDPLLFNIVSNITDSKKQTSGWFGPHWIKGARRILPE
jgi:hypothetical protein